MIKLYNDDDIVYNRDIHGDSLGIFRGICQTFHHENGGPLENGAFIMNMGIILRLNLGRATCFETHRCIKKQTRTSHDVPSGNQTWQVSKSLRNGGSHGKIIAMFDYSVSTYCIYIG